MAGAANNQRLVLACFETLLFLWAERFDSDFNIARLSRPNHEMTDVIQTLRDFWIFFAGEPGESGGLGRETQRFGRSGISASCPGRGRGESDNSIEHGILLPAGFLVSNHVQELG